VVLSKHVIHYGSTILLSSLKPDNLTTPYLPPGDTLDSTVSQALETVTSDSVEHNIEFNIHDKDEDQI
jgi:hypothetical protein